ncbi:unnamed protein product [Closterium sp. Yama58-4]|nr:unnamed protein product [Closterium sp. Yama58-4]
MADDEVVEVRAGGDDEQGEVKDGASDYEDYGDEDGDDDGDDDGDNYGDEEEEESEEEVEEDTQGVVEEEEVQEADTPRGNDSQYKASRFHP